jgi:hypothetical protein
MKQLKDYIDLQPLTGMSDMEIITSYFIDNNMEEEAMEITHNLAKAKITKMKQNEWFIKTWAYTLPSEYLYNNYPVKVATMLHRIELDYIVNREVTNIRLEWAKENIPNLKMPEIYFFPCIDWLKEQGIRFKDDEEEN